MQSQNVMEVKPGLNSNQIEKLDWEELLRQYVKRWEHEHPQFAGEDGFKRMMNSTASKIEDSFNNLLMFINYTDMDVVKGHISNGSVLTLEDYTGYSTEELEKLEPGFADEYNTLVDKFKNPNLTFDMLRNIINEAIELKNSRDWYRSCVERI